MQSSLGFARITADDARQQREHIAQRLADELALLPVVPSVPKRRVGRPKRPLSASEVLQAAAVPATAAASAATASASISSLTEPPSKRGRYTNWFTSPYLTDILAAYSRHGCSARSTVTALRRTHPDGRFDRLSHATLGCWFDKQHRLLPQFQKQVDEHVAAARGMGRANMLSHAPEVEQEIKRVLLLMRSAGTPLNSRVIRWVMLAIMQEQCPALLCHFKLSQRFISRWVRHQLEWRWRARTTAASKLPANWEDQGVLMAKRIAATMEMHKVHPSLVINMDQTGVHLVPSSAWTYEKKNSSSVAVVGADDKRQITVCLASSLSGNLLPLQLIFQGKTARSLPPSTPSSIASLAHLTFSENHWSSQATMQQYISEIIMPYAETCIQQHRLHSDAKILLVLDVWAVHKSEEFRRFLRTQHPRIHLVFVPANCTSKLQVADVALQRPYKNGITQRFNQWAAQQIKLQIQEGNVVGLNESMKMGTIKPLVLLWCIDSWSVLKERRDLITETWHKCCVSLFNVMDPIKRMEAVAAVARQELEQAHVPAEEELQEDDEESDDTGDEEDEDEDELDLTQERQFGSRKSDRQRTQAAAFGFQLDSSAIAMTEDSES